MWHWVRLNGKTLMVDPPAVISKCVLCASFLFFLFLSKLRQQNLFQLHMFEYSKELCET